MTSEMGEKPEWPSTPWMQTRSTGGIDLIDPQPEQVDLIDVADGLEQARYCNQLQSEAHRPWTVAQHSVIVGTLLAKRARVAGRDPHLYMLAGLLHDAHEAYLGDTPGPVQAALGHLLPEVMAVELKRAWRSIERSIDRAIVKRIELDFNVKLGAAMFAHEVQAHVKQADLDVLLFERRVLRHTSVGRPWTPSVEARHEEMCQGCAYGPGCHTELVDQCREEIRTFTSLIYDIAGTQDPGQLWHQALHETLARYGR